MRHVIAAELRNGTWNLRFLCGAALIFVAAMVTGRPYITQILENGGVEGTNWFAAYTYCITAGNTLMFIPIAAPLAAGKDAEAELHSRFSMYYCSRIGMKRYFVSKAVGSAMAGGLSVCLGIGFLLTCLPPLFWKTPELYENSSGMAEITISVALSFLRCFLNGAQWSLAGSLAAVMTKSRYLAYAVPFILYYILTVFQERYYRKLFFLSPRFWGAPVYYSNFICIIILLVLCSMLGLLFMGAVKRRMEHG